MDSAANPYRYLDSDIHEALSEFYEDDYDVEDFIIEKRGSVPILEVTKMAEPAYAPFIASGSLKGLPESKVIGELKTIKGNEFSKMASSWLAKGLPAIVFVDTTPQSEPSYLLCDGHHRLAVADAIGESHIDIDILKRRVGREGRE